MKLTTDSNALIEAINWASKTNGPNDDVIVLEVTDEGAASLWHLGPEAYIQAPLALNETPSESLKIALDGTSLTRIVAGLKLIPGDVSLSLTGTGSSKVLTVASLVQTKTRFRIGTYTSKPGAAPDFVTLGEINEGEYFDTLKGINGASAREEEVPMTALRSVDLSFGDKSLTMMATNRWALAESVLDFTPDENAPDVSEKHFLLPRESAALIAGGKDADESVEIIYAEASSKIGYRFADGRVALFGLNSGESLPYERTKNSAKEGITREATVSLADLKGRIRMISSLPESDGTVHWTVSEDSFEIHDEKRENVMLIDASVSLDDTDESEIAFIQVVLDVALGVIRTQSVKLKWTEKESHVLVVPVLDDGTESSNVFVFAGAKS